MKLIAAVVALSLLVGSVGAQSKGNLFGDIWGASNIITATTISSGILRLSTGSSNGIKFAGGTVFYDDNGAALLQAFGSLYLNPSFGGIFMGNGAPVNIGAGGIDNANGAALAVSGLVSATSIRVGYQAAGVTPSAFIVQGSSAYTSTGILCSYNGSAWKKYDGTNCTF